MTGQYRFLNALKHDLPAGIAVFLIAIPLSLGIALASGAPLFSGLITGIIGGLVVAPLSGSALGVSGTAAGLAVLVLTEIEQLGFNAFLLAVVLSGLLQILMGLVKAGVIGYYFPSSVINGMLSGIGIIVFLKQIPHAIGYDSDYEGDLSFFQTDSYSSFTELQHMLSFISPTAMLIAAFSLLILVTWEWLSETKPRMFQPIHGVLLAVLSGVVINQLIRQVMPDMALRESHLVALPVLRSVTDFSEQLHFPDFSALNNPSVYLAAMTLAIVASLETLLSVEAVDKLDADKRTTPTNRELLAQGVGNICSGLLGGLPLTQVIVRSSLNVQAGARSKYSAIFHGVLLLLAAICIPQLLNEIPLASLAAILLVVSYKLTKPEIVASMYRAGWYHFVPFLATVFGLVLTDMLTGVVIGLSTALFAILLENYKSAEYFQAMRLGNKTILRLAEHVSFLNKANIQQTLKKLPMFSEVVIDASRCKYIDYDVYEIIKNFQRDAEVRRITLTLNNFRGHGELPPITNARPPGYDAQKSLTPNDVLALLKEGNLRFVNNLEANRNFLEQVNDTGQGQFPIAIILSCMDSRTSVELIFDQGLGDVFSVRVAGNVVNDDILGSMEYACKIAGSKLIVVLGHSHCGAVKGACAHAKLDHLTGLLAKIQPAVDAVSSNFQGETSVENDGFVQQVADKNVLLAVESIKQQSPVLNAMISTGEIGLVGGMYDIATGKVRFYPVP